MRVLPSKPDTLRCACMLGAFAASMLWHISILAETLKAQVTLPVEVMGAEGTVAAVTVELSQSSILQIKSLWLQIHGLEYPDLASVRVNQGPWVSLNNQSVAVAQPELGYGGIGGAFATLKMTLALAPGSVVAGANRI